MHKGLYVIWKNQLAILLMNLIWGINRNYISLQQKLLQHFKKEDKIDKWMKKFYYG